MEIAEKLDIRIINMAGNPDHVHLLYETSQNISQIIYKRWLKVIEAGY